MYLDEGTWFALFLLAAAVAGAWFWSDTLRARDLMLQTCRRLCRELKVQFLDDSVVLTHIRLGRGDGGWPQFTREYQFEFSGTGQDRWHGRASLAGQRVLSVQFEHPEGVTILGGGAPVSPELLRLARTSETGDTTPPRRLH